jgi:DNA recombination-dependent growth factor C
LNNAKARPLHHRRRKEGTGRKRIGQRTILRRREKGILPRRVVQQELERKSMKQN